jgi:hypothetical protein
LKNYFLTLPLNIPGKLLGKEEWGKEEWGSGDGLNP